MFRTYIKHCFTPTSTIRLTIFYIMCVNWCALKGTWGAYSIARPTIYRNVDRIGGNRAFITGLIPIDSYVFLCWIIYYL